MAESVPILYSFFGVASGSLGSMPFNNAPFVILFPTNTSRIYTDTILYPQPVLRVSSERSADTISIFGLQTAIFNFGLNLTLLNNSLILGMDVDQLLGVNSPAFQNYGLNTAIGPVSGTPVYVSKPYPTTTGDLVITSVSSASFQAIPVSL